MSMLKSPVVRAVALLAALTLGAALPAQAQTKVLRMAPMTDLRVLDPLFTTALAVRNHAYMVFDTPLALDSKGVPRAQMVDSWTQSKGGLVWTFKLRAGLKFHDGSEVTPNDVVVSLQRWSKKDPMGLAIAKAGGVFSASGASSFTLTLTQPYGGVLEALAKSSSYPPFIMPARIAQADLSKPITEIVGSGPYMFKKDEWVPGNKIVWVKSPYYVPRKEPADGLSGGKVANLDRVEWQIMPDPNTQAQAIRRGEIDLIEGVGADFIAPMLADKDLKVIPLAPFQGIMYLNQLHPPFNNTKARQAILHIIKQSDLMAGLGYPVNLRMPYCGAVFVCGSANATDAGTEPYRQPDLAKAKKLLDEAGYKGEKIVVLVPSGVPVLGPLTQIAVKQLQAAGLNIDAQVLDFGSLVTRRTRKDAPDKGGWNIYVTAIGQSDLDTPIANNNLLGGCANVVPGLVCDESIQKMTASWLSESRPAERRKLVEGIQRRAYEVVSFVPLGQFIPVIGVRRDVKNTQVMEQTGIPAMWGISK
jgi:peptide/nickel transport system substrate-binding protein